ncbi:MAG TPA: 50S ribosomal protein L17 [Desulfomonilia bacterium]
MYHRISGRKLGMKTDVREAMLKNMVTSLIVHERITTTVTRAKELRKIADRMITLGKKGNLAAVRQAAVTVKTKEALGKLFKDLGPRFAERNGGYTRIIRSSNRKGDNAPMVIMEWVDKAKTEAAEKKS